MYVLVECHFAIETPIIDFCIIVPAAESCSEAPAIFKKGKAMGLGAFLEDMAPDKQHCGRPHLLISDAVSSRQKPLLLADPPSPEAEYCQGFWQ